MSDDPWGCRASGNVQEFGLWERRVQKPKAADWQICHVEMNKLMLRLLVVGCFTKIKQARESYENIQLHDYDGKSFREKNVT